MLSPAQLRTDVSVGFLLFVLDSPDLSALLGVGTLFSHCFSPGVLSCFFEMY